MFSNKYKRKANAGNMHKQEREVNTSPVPPLSGLSELNGIMDFDNNIETGNTDDSTKRAWTNANSVTDMGSTASSNRSSPFTSTTSITSITPSPSSINKNNKRFKWLFDDHSFDPMDTEPPPSSPVELVKFTNQPFDDFKKPFDTPFAVPEKYDQRKASISSK